MVAQEHEGIMGEPRRWEGLLVLVNPKVYSGRKVEGPKERRQLLILVISCISEAVVE